MLDGTARGRHGGKAVDGAMRRPVSAAKVLVCTHKFCFRLHTPSSRPHFTRGSYLASGRLVPKFIRHHVSCRPPLPRSSYRAFEETLCPPSTDAMTSHCSYPVAYQINTAERESEHHVVCLRGAGELQGGGWWAVLGEANAARALVLNKKKRCHRTRALPIPRPHYSTHSTLT